MDEIDPGQERDYPVTSAVEQVERSGVVAIVRLDDYRHAVDMTAALLRGGVDAVEFTYTNPRAGDAIDAVKAAHGGAVLVGAGTVLDPETARAAILQGADFVVTPTLNPATIRLCLRYSIPTVIGAFTPTEMLTAWEHGATFVKVFPARAVGPGYLKDVLGPLPHLRLIPTGGVDLDNAGSFIRAGARAIAVGSNLVDSATVASGDWDAIASRAAGYVDVVSRARSGA